MVYPEPRIRAQQGLPPLSAVVAACARKEGVYESCVKGNLVALMRIRMAERGVPPAIPVATRLLTQIDPEKGLGTQLRKHLLVPGLSGMKALDTFADALPTPADPQACWERWAAGLIGLKGYTLKDSTDSALLLPSVFIGCRPSWRRGPVAAMWQLCWASSRFPPPPGWAPEKNRQSPRRRALRAPAPRGLVTRARRKAYA